MNPTSRNITRRQFVLKLSAPTLALATFPYGDSAAERKPVQLEFNVKNYGARGNGETLDTAALQKAIDECAQAGGGKVRFPPGRYLTGTVFLKSHVTVYLEAGATLVGSTRLEDYPITISKIRSYTDNYTERSLIYGEDLEQITLCGRGLIDGRGASFKGQYKVRPYTIRIINCRDVSVRELTLKDSPMWVQHYLSCDGVSIDGITVMSKCNANNDGIDIDGCQRVRISNCDIRSGDDAIVLKSTLDRPCKNVAVTNCILSSDCNAFKLGTESNGGFQNIVVSNCAIYDTRLAGIALEEVDGGTLEGVSVSNITMENVRGPIFIRLGNRARPFQENMAKPDTGSLRNITISNIQAVGADMTGCCIAGLPDHPVENITLTNVRIRFAGGGKPEHGQRRPEEKPVAYPEYSMFGTLPAYGFYCRHARNVLLENVEVSVASPDERQSLQCEDVEGLKLVGWSAAPTPAKAPVIRFEDVRDAMVQSCAAPRGREVFLSVAGKRSTRIGLQGNDLGGMAEAVKIDPELAAGTVRVNGTSLEKAK